ncbi:glycosyltransferase [Candidatus Woesearchaeota archaeon]|jgi:glycosyltransferase involved in cell wall biosynthesis|nr:glycosyltransferase [Candidatus Woesearchaeota archaeon]
MDQTKPKVLLVADTYYPQIDGTLIFMEEFIKKARINFDLSLLIPNLSSKRIKGIKTEALKVSKIFKLSGYPSMKLSWSNLKIIKKSIKETDIVFVQGPALISYLAAYFAKKQKKKTIFFLHTLTWELLEQFLPPLVNTMFRGLIKKFSIMIYNKCDLLMIPYNDLEEKIRKEGIKTKTQVARLGVDIDRFYPSENKEESKKKVKIDPRKKVIGYVGRISKEKNASVLLKALDKIGEKNVLLLMVGDGTKEMVEDFKNNKRCKVTGFTRDVEDYYRAMDVFVMPSLTETTSLATLEAMSSGLPVVVTKVGFMQHYIVKDYNGVFFPRANPSLLALKLDKLLRNEELGERLGHNARKTISYSFSWERSINKIKRVILNLYYS